MALYIRITREAELICWPWTRFKPDSIYALTSCGFSTFCTGVVTLSFL